ncbi:homocysteine S-methyltransferase family protein [Desulfosarcina sp.]|uniref:homocysteine S-methyltransferase family protein n=1 Tax=Desulfosarcina sp. TaxID=2027861 RepID=UPI0029A1F1B1|nr:homocysteine S-methyltransferase family protein [Desulfosarcina sp.]MDX2452367.1 homocysteine S-methyltransferase family protein [Desulfosarcina sp.]MDX2490147.1 homocysteine S-methyltransferase family protein [Desulfosarcina sp.]
MKRDLLQRLETSGVVCAEGYLFEMERRGYLTAGEFVPEVALDNPEALKSLHKDFQHAGSDVVVAFTYNGHREKMRVIGKEDLLEPLNRAALKIANDVAADVPEGSEPNLVAGNISNSNIWNPDDSSSQKQVREMFSEMVQWAVDEGVDYFIGETFYYAGEAFAALEAIQQSNKPAVITIAPMGENILRDQWDIIDACKELEQRGADVVGMNCFRGPNTMMPYLRKIRESLSGHMAALPIPYRTTELQPTFFNLDDNNGISVSSPHGRTFPTALDPLYCNRYEIRKFAEDAWNNNIRYLGVCCGAAPIHIREVAEAMGKTPIASRYSENMKKHFMYGTDESLPEHITSYGDKA